MIPLLQNSHWEDTGIRLDDSNNDTKDAQCRCENFYNQNLDKETGVLCITNGTGRTGNTNGNSGRNVGKTNRKAGREHSVSSVIVSSPIPVFVQVKAVVFGFFNFVGKDNGHNNTVNGGSFAENHTVANDSSQEKK